MRNFLYALLGVLALISSPSLAQDDFAVPPAPHKEDYFVAGLAPVHADPGANVTIVYFMDYQCPACRAHTPDVSAVFAGDHKLKVIYRDTPIFGPLSVEAAKYAIASQFQGKHDAFHRALMAQKMPLDAAAVKAAAAKAGIDWGRLEKDRAAHAKAIDAQIAQNQNLSEAAGISGTPAFIVGDILADGALDAKGLRAEIADARAKAPKPAPEPAAKAPAGEKAESSEKTTEALVTDNAVGADNDKEPAPTVVQSNTSTAAPMFSPSDASPAADRPESSGLLLPLLAGAFALTAIAFLLLRRRRGVPRD